MAENGSDREANKIKMKKTSTHIDGFVSDFSDGGRGGVGKVRPCWAPETRSIRILEI